MSMPATELYPVLQTEICGLTIVDLAKKYGTPFYIYDAAKIAERIADLAAFDVVRYAQKACSNLAVLDLVRRHGGVVDAVSVGEVRRAIAAGFDPRSEAPHQIIYTADIFDRAALELIGELNLPVNCGSPDMIDQYGEVCRQRGQKQGITLRINPGFGHGHSQKTNTGGEQSKHGIWHEQVGDCLKRAAKWGLTVTGLHMHIGSGSDMEHLSQVGSALERIASEVGPSLETISAGGGIPTPYRNDDEPVDLAGYYELWNGVRNRLKDQFGHPVSLEIEPGRYLAAESGSLITEIRAIKTMGDNLFYLVDAGFNNLARPILYGAYHPMAICPADGEHSTEMQDVIIGGPLCESGDIFTQDEGGIVCSRPLPKAKVGDFLVINAAGAYGYVMSSNYNSKPMVAEVLVEEGEPHLARAAQTFDDIIRGESIRPR